MSKKEDLGTWKFVVALLIVVAIFVAYYMFENYQNEQKFQENRYNGFDFAHSGNGLWVTEIQVQNQLYQIPFYFHPRELEDIIVHEDIGTLLFGQKPERIFISIDPDAGSRPVVAAVEISRITGHKYNLINVPTSSALSRPADIAVETPIITCEDAVNGTVVIQFVEDPEANAIVRDESCVILFYKNPEESIRVADRFAYMLLQIMPVE